MNEVTQLSNQGKITIPKDLLKTYNWRVGQEFIIVETEEGILLKPQKQPFPRTTINQVAGCLKYEKKAKSFEEIEQAVSQGIVRNWHDCS